MLMVFHESQISYILQWNSVTHMVLRMCECICVKKTLKTTKTQPNNNTDLDHTVMYVYMFFDLYFLLLTIPLPCIWEC